VLEDESGAHLDVGLDALGSGVADILARGLGPDALVEPDAAAVLEESRGRPAQLPDRHGVAPPAVLGGDAGDGPRNGPGGSVDPDAIRGGRVVGRQTPESDAP